jgi:hypothetical protein
VPRTRIRFLGRVLNAISQVEPRLRHSQEVFPVIIVGRFVRQIDTGSGVGAILTFLTHNSLFPDRPVRAKTQICRKSSIEIRVEHELQRPKAKELPPEPFAPLERRMTTSRRSAYAAVHVPVPEHGVHRPGAGR